MLFWFIVKLCATFVFALWKEMKNTQKEAGIVCFYHLNFLPSVPSAANVTKFDNFKKYLGNKFAYESSPNRQVTFGPI